MSLHIVLDEAMPTIDRGAALDDRLAAHALLGRAFARLGQAKEAAAEHRRVIALAGKVTLDETGADALGEARFFFAEEAGAAAEGVTLAPYTGAGEKQTVLRYLGGPAQRWLDRKTAALEAAERAYLRVCGVEAPPAPPPVLRGGDPNAPVALWRGGPAEGEGLIDRAASPRWAVAAAGRMGLLWAGAAREIARLPRPAAWGEPWCGAGCFIEPPFEDPPDVRLEQRAKSACEASLRVAAAHYVDDEHAGACDAWLSKRFGAEHPAVDELLPRVAGPFAVSVFSPATR
jgi:hypothetical protein